MRMTICSLLVAIFLPSVSMGETSVSGESLFHSAALGTNGKSCASCHPQGKGLEQIGDYDDGMLREFVNFCIRDAMKGKMLPEDAEQLHQLAAYLRRFQKAE